MTFDCRFEEHVRPVLGLTFLDYSYTAVSMDTQQTIVSFMIKFVYPYLEKPYLGNLRYSASMIKDV